MRAIWSFWSKPHATPSVRRPWRSEFHHALSWSLSVLEASKHYPDTWLYTDDEGARFLCDELDLPFAHVSTELNALSLHDAQWWVLGKIYAYSLQTEPFVHLDADVVLWLPLPERLERADVFAQVRDSFWNLQPNQLDGPIEAAGGWLPVEWRWFRSSRIPLWRIWADIYGGCRVDFIRHIAQSALRLVKDPTNALALSTISGKGGMTSLLEEFMVAAHIEYHAGRSDSPFRDVKPAFLFDSVAEGTNAHNLSDLGFAHLAGAIKSVPSVTNLLEHRVRTDYPAQFDRCRRAVGEAAYHGS